MADAFIGEIRMFAGNYVPADWKSCDGSLLSVSEYQALFALIGTTYGGNGVSTFGLPNLNGRVPIGTGSGTGLPSYLLGASGGSDAVTLIEGQMPAHTHQVYASTSSATASIPGSTLTFATLTDPNRLYLNISGAKTGTPVQFSASAISAVHEGGASHDNVMPTMPLTYIMCATTGVFPQE